MQIRSQSLPEINHMAFKGARERHRLSQEQLANQLCLSSKHIDQLENQHTTVFFSLSHKVHVAKKVACHLGIPLEIALIDKSLPSSMPSVNKHADSPVTSTVNTKEQNPTYNITSQKINELAEISLEIPAQQSKKSSKIILLSLAILLTGTTSVSTLLYLRIHPYNQQTIESDSTTSQITSNDADAKKMSTNIDLTQAPNTETFTPNQRVPNNNPSANTTKP